MNRILRAEMPPQPGYAEGVRDMAFLDKDVLTAPYKIGGIKCRLHLGNHIIDVSISRGLSVVMVVKFILELGLGSRSPLSPVAKILLNERAIGRDLEVSLSPGHGRFDNLVPNDQHHVPRHGCIDAAAAVPLGS